MGLIGFSHLILPCILQKHKSFVSVIMKKNTNHNEKIRKGYNFFWNYLGLCSALGTALRNFIPSFVLC